MRTTLIPRAVWLCVLFGLLALGSCSDSTAPGTDGPGTDPVDEVEVTVLDPLTLSEQQFLVDTPADLVARIKVEAPAPYVIDGVSLHRLDADGESLAQLMALRDDGETASADVIAGDKIYSGMATDLLYAEPDTMPLAVRITASDPTEGAISTWTEPLPMPVLKTDLVFTAGPIAVPQGITTAVSTDLRVLSELMVADSLDLDRITLYRVTSDNDSVFNLGPLADNGNLDNGDEIMGDGNYTSIVQDLLIVAPQTVYLKALATATSNQTGLVHRTWSPTLGVPVEYPPVEGIVTVALAYQDSLETLWAEYLDGGYAPAAAKDSLLAWFVDRDHVDDNFLSPDGGALWYVMHGGLECGVVLNEPGGEPVYGATRPHRDPAETAHLMSVGVPASPRAAAALRDRNLEFPDEVDSNIALIYSPFHTAVDALPGQDDPAVAVSAMFEDAHCPSFGVTRKFDAEATVSVLQDLYRYGAISIFTHGVQLDGGEIALLTGETVDYERCVQHAWDLFTAQPNACIVRLDGASYFAVKPQFFSKYNLRFPNSIVQVAACYGTMNNALSLAFTGNGAGFVAGYDASVTVGFAAESSVAFWRNLLEDGDRSGAAHGNVTPLIEPGHRGAEFTATGNPELYYGTDMQNGGFELGSLAAWEKAGDGRVISRLDDQLPIDGNAMGIVSTGLGYTESTGEITQVVCLPAAATTLRFHYNYFSEEFLEWCGSGYQDYFQVSLTPEGGGETVLYYVEIDDMCDDVIPANIQFDQGPLGDDNGVYYTGWREISAGISSWAGQTVTLRFAAGDIGDSIFDSAILIDAIIVE